MLVWIIAIVVLGLLFGVAVERLMAKFGIQRQEPDEPVTLMRDVRSRVESWQERHSGESPHDRPRRQ